MNKSSHCKNCNTPLNGQYCHNCGQKDLDLRKPFREVFSELIGPVADFDKKLFKTLYEYLRHPGKVPAGYMAGKRKTYLPPIRLYLIVSIFFFTLIKISEADFLQPDNTGGKQATTVELKIDSSDNEAKVKAEAEAETETETETEVKTETENSEEDSFKFMGMNMDEKIDHLNNDPKSFRNLWLNSFPYVLFFLLPLFSFITWLFFRKSRPYYLSHLVFSAGIQTLIILAMLLLFLLDYVFSVAILKWVTFALIGYIGTNILLAMKRFFTKKYGYTLVAFTVISFINFITLLTATVFSLLLTMLFL